MLAVGLDPEFADFSQFPQLTPALIVAYIRQQTDRIRDMGLEVVDCLISPDDAGEQMLKEALTARAFDCVLIGAGLREPPNMLPLFERVINRVHRLAPSASICFNTTPADSAEAVQRWIEG
ncbi:MAG: hypothetical protein J7498_15055 [Sphingobium sp.]|nr:hypothetical protein [Sphingobium sp.]